ncbi:hypothetical protein [Colwellia sp. MB3u-55]|jgi:hypothetical protein|uniref:hypothetical protein n=1 Tax=Colwellia sp. MB3u-55 TaxID=2759810 RepID=UPI0015F57330|nr:hypothetical protein [Colwellia sp. MB3u-55]MBA6251800.1 hypothetical protein [Colwellia sp. MB3u-55]
MQLNDFLGKAAWAFIPGLLFIICPWFAALMTAGITEVSYDVNKQSINGLTSVFINLTNTDNTAAVDTLELKVPQKNRLYSSLSKEKSNVKIDDWKGELAINESLELLIIMDADVSVDHKFVNALFKGKYQDRDELTGKQKWVDVKLAEKGMIALNKSSLFFVWYLVPLLLSLLIAIIIIKVMNRGDGEE